MKQRAMVIGDGGWGTALAMVLHDTGHDVTVWGPFPDTINAICSAGENTAFLPGVPLPSEIVWTADPAAAEDAELAVLAVPTQYFEDVMTRFAKRIPKTCRVVSVAKGLSEQGHERMSQVAERVLDHAPVAALSGPSHAEEVARHMPTAVTVGCMDADIATAIQTAFASNHFRVYTSSDVMGVELGGALKNVIAIAVGVSDGLGFGDNTRAALITRGLAEISRLGTGMGASPLTFAGLSGMGDLVVTCTSRLSRNRAVGERIGHGESIDDILGSMQQVAEGVRNARCAQALAQSLDIDVPITDQVCAMLHEGRSPHDAVTSLLSRDVKPE